LSSIAFMIASSDKGTAPRWNAKPSNDALVAMLSPIQRGGKAGRIEHVEMIGGDSLVGARRASFPASKSRSGLITKLAVGSIHRRRRGPAFGASATRRRSQDAATQARDSIRPRFRSGNDARRANEAFTSDHLDVLDATGLAPR